MFSIKDCIIQLATPSLPLGHAPVRFRPPTVRRKREKADESISRIHMSTKSPYTKVLREPLRRNSDQSNWDIIFGYISDFQDDERCCVSENSGERATISTTGLQVAITAPLSRILGVLFKFRTLTGMASFPNQPVWLPQEHPSGGLGYESLLQHI
ncbi:hypothetical protein AVEN_88856-1 [Araneus ventricosus]|uniref:Uncharacterized protein n=1 Tax=Araneus ventricosus TaxID=182803 RepID=A0A4Y2CN80_ARAVE|nr:hypothetical protein AVEN_88856-1 [Araneus ventricosus]